MSGRLNEALDVVDATDAYDSSTEARGRRAHARVLATIELAEATAKLHREQRIANLLQLAQLDTKDSAWALKEARKMLAADGGLLSKVKDAA
ncbi:hypothetical protein GCM10023081_42630 [Arthrobacter ginkgonis]|uniref:Uncharacterized protein n=1 Tax=Arthrobacter ginkgonis TaxID=1630594 RepID=A0ABP7D6S6_9MICC